MQQVRADSAAYQGDTFNWCEGKKTRFAIRGCQDAAVKTLIATTPESAWRPFEDGEVIEVIHSMEKTGKAFWLIILRLFTQGDLYENKEPKVHHTVIASHREESAEETILWYRRRGETSENRIKDLKVGFGMERMHCGDFWANAVFFRLGILAYNLFILFKLQALPKEWRCCQVQTLAGGCIRSLAKSSHTPEHRS